MNTYERLVLRLLLAIFTRLLMDKHGMPSEVGRTMEHALRDETVDFLTKTPKM
jgi:hypothetical protein